MHKVATKIKKTVSTALTLQDIMEIGWRVNVACLNGELTDDEAQSLFDLLTARYKSLLAKAHGNEN
jgi:hypothetical protein